MGSFFRDVSAELDQIKACNFWISEQFAPAGVVISLKVPALHGLEPI